MGRFALFLAILVLATLAGGAIYLGTKELPPPTERVEKIIPNDRFPR